MAVKLGPIHRPDWGKDTFTRPAADLVKIAVAFGNYDAQEVVLRCVIGSKSDRVNITTVEQVLGEISDEWEAEHGNAEG